METESIELKKADKDINLAVILCAGKGERFGGKKQFIKLAGKPVCIHTLDVFIKTNLFREIFLVVSEDDIDLTRNLLNKYFPDKKEVTICKGGKSRQESSRNAVLCALKKGYPLNTKVLIHDAVRPFVDKQIIKTALHNISEEHAVDTVVKAIDTIVEVDEDNFIVKIPPRHKLRYGQTPQGFLLGHLKEMYTKTPLEDLPRFTDDCSIFLNVFKEKKVLTIEGDYSNIKITTPLDLYLADKIFLLKKFEKIEKISQIVNNIDKITKHIRNKVIIVFGGTSGIGKAIADITSKLGGITYVASRRTGVDLRNPLNVKSYLKMIYDKEGKINHIIITSGVLIKKPLIKMSIDEIREQIETNYFGSIITVKESLDILKRTREKPKHIILFSSSSYTRGRGLYSVYSSSKAAIVNFAQALCEELDDVNVNVVVPERTNTPMRRRWFGIENPATLLNPYTVALYTLYLLTLDVCGISLEVRKTHEDIDSWKINNLMQEKSYYPR